MGQYLDFVDGEDLPDSFVLLVQAVMLAACDFRADRLADQPLLLFASLVPLARSQGHFDYLVDHLLASIERPRKLAGIIWNCFVKLGQVSDLAMIPLTEFRVSDFASDYFLMRLPELFTDLFSRKNGAAEILKFPDARAVARCLKCGVCLRADDGQRHLIRHAKRCPFELFLALTGEAASGIVHVPLNDQPVLTIPSLYLTERGVDDVGLSRGVPLALAKERQRSLMEEVLLGKYFGAPADPDCVRRCAS